MEKIDRFFSYILVLALGISLGIYWRVSQVENGIDSKIEGLQKERREIMGSIISLETRIKNLEKKLRIR